MARLRLQAGNCVLRLAQENVYSDMVTLEQFQTLALLINVSSCYIYIYIYLDALYIKI